MTSSKSSKGQWGRWGAFCLALGVVVACGKDNEPGRDVPITGEHGGSSSTGTGGAGGVDTGGAANGSDEGPVPGRLTSGERRLELEMKNVAGAYTLNCVSDPQLLEVDPPEDVSELPEIDGGTSYYLDGSFKPNRQRGYGCDQLFCEPYPTQLTFTKRGVVLTGTQAAPDDIGEAGGAGPGEEVSTFESYERKGPFFFVGSYYPDADCAEEPIQLGPFQIELTN